MPNREIFQGIDVLVHCAWDMRTRTRPEMSALNIEGTRRLLDAASSAGVKRVVFVSSLSAYEGSEQLYGRSKLDCEHAVFEIGGVVARLGLVYGPRAGDMFDVLTRLASFPIVPVTASSNVSHCQRG